MGFKETLIQEIEMLESLPISSVTDDDIDIDIDFNLILKYLKLAKLMEQMGV